MSNEYLILHHIIIVKQNVKKMFGFGCFWFGKFLLLSIVVDMVEKQAVHLLCSLLFILSISLLSSSLFLISFSSSSFLLLFCGLLLSSYAPPAFFDVLLLVSYFPLCSYSLLFFSHALFVHFSLVCFFSL